MSQSSFNCSDFSSKDDRRIIRRSASQHHNRYGDNGIRRKNPEIWLEIWPESDLAELARYSTCQSHSRNPVHPL